MATQASLQWTYASLRVIDGDRILQPTQVSFGHLLFAAPPRLTSVRIEVLLTNGDEAQHTWATVLPHDPSAMRIPIRLDLDHQGSNRCSAAKNAVEL